MLYLYLEAPFAACRTFTAGWYRPTANFLTPSAAYGLILNAAGIESRLREHEPGHDGKTPASYQRTGLPACRLALGAVNHSLPQLQSVYQQLHNYPVGASGKARAEECKGSKYNITPVRREFLSNLCAILVLDRNPNLEDRVRLGLRGSLASARYGVPFVGDNAFLPDFFEEIIFPDPRVQSVQWYERLGTDTTTARPGATRLTCLIDRADLSKTQSALFAPSAEESRTVTEPPEAAWVAINPPADAPPAVGRKRSK